MWRAAIFILFMATLAGALMPSGPWSSDMRARDPVRVDRLEGEGGATATETSEAGSDGLTLQRNFDGHFYADAEVNGTTVHFLIDTGASGIALSADDARRAGLAFTAGEAEVVGSGASGEVLGHFVELESVELGERSVSDAPAVILEGGDRSLLGQSFLSQFDLVEVRGNTMVLR